jgi:hypothetical protein
LRYEAYDVAIDVGEDGSFTVTAVQTVRFDDAYSTAFAEIPTERAAAVRDIAVFERDDGGTLTPLSFTVSDETNVQYVDWEYDETEAGEARTFVLQYTVEGGLWVYADRDYLRWFAVNAERSGLPVEEATVTVTLPESAAGSLSAQVISGNGVGAAVENRARFETSAPLADGEAFEIEVGFAHDVVQAARQTWQQAEDAANVRVSIPEVRVGVTVQYDGRLDVTEETRIAVESGVLEQGYRSIALLYMDEIANVGVLQDGRALPMGQEGCSDCFVLRRQPGFDAWAAYDDGTGEVIVDEGGTGRIDIDWYGTPVEAGETTQITLQYDIVGGVRVGEDAQVIHLEVLPDYDAATESGWLQIMPPPRAQAGEISVESGAVMAGPEMQADGSLLFRNLELPAERARWEVVVTMPPGATSAVRPRWQAQFEAAVAAQSAAAVQAARRTLATRTSAIVTGLAGLAAGVWIWFRYGRKRVRGLLKGYVAEPPSELAPGIVAYLMDRATSERGVLASLMQLATVGLIEVDLTNGVRLRRKTADALRPGQRFAQQGGGTVSLAPHQTMLFNDVLLPSAPMDRFVALDDLAGPLRARLPNLFAQMGEDAQAYFLVETGGGCVRGCLTPTVLIPAAAVALGGVLLFGGRSTWALLFAIAGFSFAALMLVLALGQPFGRRRSASGEAEAEKWTRFRNYLMNIKEYGDLGVAQEILDRHFAYVIALGVEEMVLAQADALGASVPGWVVLSSAHGQGWNRPGSGPWATDDAGPRPVQTGTGGAPVATPAAPSTLHTPGPRPSLSGMSSAMGASLSGASRNLGATLSAAAGATAATVVLRSKVRDRTMEWGAQSNPTQMLDEVMRLSLRDAESIRSRPARSGPSAPGWGGAGLGGGSSRSTWGSGSSRAGSSRGRSSSSGGFGRSAGSSSSRSSAPRSSSSRSSAPRSRPSGGGRSGFGKK